MYGVGLYNNIRSSVMQSVLQSLVGPASIHKSMLFFNFWHEKIYGTTYVQLFSVQKPCRATYRFWKASMLTGLDRDSQPDISASGAIRIF